MPQLEPFLQPAVVPSIGPSPSGNPVGKLANSLRALAPPQAADLARTLKPESLVVEEATSHAMLAALEAQWQDLADQAVEANVFYEPWMALPALEHLAGANVRVVLVHAPHPSGRKGERLLCGLFPLEQISRRGVRVLQSWRYPFCYLGTPLLRRGCAREALNAFLGWVGEQAPRTGPLRLLDLHGSGELRRQVVDLSAAKGFDLQLDSAYTRAFFRRATDAETFLRQAPMGGRHRKELRRLESRLAEQGTLTYRTLEDENELPTWLAQFERLEAKGWKGTKKVAVQLDPEHQAWFERTMKAAFARGRLQLLALELDGKPLAMKLNLLSQGGGVAFKITYDEAYAKYSPGVLLELENIRQLHQGCLSWMDSCAAPNRFMINQLWPERVEVQSLWLVPPHARGAWAVAALPLMRLASGRLRQLKARFQRRTSR